MNANGPATASHQDRAVTTLPPGWSSIGTVVGNTTTDGYTFILRSMQGKLGDIVATKVEVPSSAGQSSRIAMVWGRITSIGRFNPFFPAEAAQELANENIHLLDTVLSGSRDHLEAEVLILGSSEDGGSSDLSPLTYPVQPSAQVLYPPADDVRRLLTGDDEKKKPPPPKLEVGTLIARGDVEVSLSAKHIVSRHLAILAMTGGGKTVAARRIIRELIRLKYPLVIFDPHGDYLGLFEKREILNSKIKILYPRIRVRDDNVNIISELIDKMGKKLSDAQQQFYFYLLNNTPVKDGETAAVFIQRMIDFSTNIAAKKSRGAKGEKGEKGSKKSEKLSEDLDNTRPSTMNVVKRSLDFVLTNLKQMEGNNERLRSQKRFKGYEFTEMPDPADSPDQIVAPGMVSIFYLAGYDHLNQSAIVSIVLEALFSHRSTLSDVIPPFQAIIEEAHNFIPSRTEGIDETPSLPTIRKVITEGRKFGTGLILISQRPSRLDETTLSQCNSFLVLRLVNPRDKNFVRSVMENLSETDANILQTFGPGQGIVSGQAVRFPLLVKVKFDADLVSQAIGDEDFIKEASDWKPNAQRQANLIAVEAFKAREKTSKTKDAPQSGDGTQSLRPKRRPGRRGHGIKPQI